MKLIPTRTHRLILIAALLLAIFPAAIGATSPAYKPDGKETLHYKVMFKWGLIYKQAGSATLTLRPDGNGGFITTLTAASAPWADKFYCVRDTLRGNLSPGEWKPVFYEKIAHEGGESKHDKVFYQRIGPSVKASCIRKVWDKKGNLKIDEQRQLEAYGTTVDMLTSFFYMRSLPFQTWAPGHTVAVNLFSGKQKELLTIKYIGREPVEIDGTPRECYRVTFIFTSKGGKKSSDDMDAWISADSARIPLRLEGKLPVGKVHCLYQP
ncbi:MAG: DUF3108 domain-containing protein [Muribaculaceae bacterium]|nr:DUF3108 domain-containing protein [Muribaculaceae bacterium]